MPRYSVYILMRLRGYGVEGKLNIYMLAQRLMIFFLLLIELFTFEHCDFQKFIFSYDAKICGNRVKNRHLVNNWFVLHHVALKTKRQ